MNFTSGYTIVEPYPDQIWILIADLGHHWLAVTFESMTLSDNLWKMHILPKEIVAVQP